MIGTVFAKEYILWEMHNARLAYGLIGTIDTVKLHQTLCRKGIIKCIDYGECTVQGKNLFLTVFPAYTFVASDVKIMSMKSVQSVSREMLLAVQALHNHGYVHGDLTLSNFVLDNIKGRYLVRCYTLILISKVN
jgi:serine/threonine protein kinase